MARERHLHLRYETGALVVGAPLSLCYTSVVLSRLVQRRPGDAGTRQWDTRSRT